MKKFCIITLLIAIITLTVAVGVEKPTKKYEYLRIHVRANSNSEADQQIKMTIKDVTVEYLTPFIVNCESKKDALNVINSVENSLENVINVTLLSKGFNYTCNVKTANEKFPLRVYDNVTLEEGYYDAVIVELGKAEGDNWWCVMYPPLCFYGSETNVKYKSKIKEIIDEFFS
jgi:stage II sporulation protein R